MKHISRWLLRQFALKEDKGTIVISKRELTRYRWLTGCSIGIALTCFALFANAVNDTAYSAAALRHAAVLGTSTVRISTIYQKQKALMGEVYSIHAGWPETPPDQRKTIRTSYNELIDTFNANSEELRAIHQTIITEARALAELEEFHD